ncbi:hypothetical protein Hanom_Chr07g00645911 [Helianthus anomalus]
MNTYLFVMLVGTEKSSKSASRFSVSDLQEYASSRSLKKELAARTSISNPKSMSTRGRKFAEVQILLDQHLAEAEQKNLDFQQMFLAKDKKISSLEKEVNLLQKELVLAQIITQQEKAEVMEGAKLSATIAMLKIKLQMAKEAEDPAFDRSEWDQEAWKQRLPELDDEDESEGVAAGEAEDSGFKDPEVAVGGDGKGDGEKVVEAAKV